MIPHNHTPAAFGWTGTIVHVNLSDAAVTRLDTPAYSDKYLGGRGIATRLYWEMVRPDTDALAPDNHLIFMTGPLGATGAQGASRFVAAGKSPMTLPEGFCCGNLGGYFGPYLKRAGFDGLVITGRADRPVYLYIDDGDVQIRDAADLWGQGVSAVQERLKNIHGNATRMITTGIAGENRWRGGRTCRRRSRWQPPASAMIDPFAPWK